MKFKIFILLTLLLGGGSAAGLAGAAHADDFQGRGPFLLLVGSFDCDWSRRFLAPEKMEPYVDPQSGLCLGGFAAAKMREIQSPLLPSALSHSGSDLLYWAIMIANPESHRPTWFFPSLVVGQPLAGMIPWMPSAFPADHWQPGRVDWTPDPQATHAMRVRGYGKGDRLLLDATMGASAPGTLVKMDDFNDEPVVFFPRVPFLGNPKFNATASGTSYSRPYDEQVGDSLYTSPGSPQDRLRSEGRFKPMMWTLAIDMGFRYYDFTWARK